MNRILFARTSFRKCFYLRHTDISPDTRPSNSFRELALIWASCLATLQPAATAASQQVLHTSIQYFAVCVYTNYEVQVYMYKNVELKSAITSLRTLQWWQKKRGNRHTHTQNEYIPKFKNHVKEWRGIIIYRYEKNVVSDLMKVEVEELE